MKENESLNDYSSRLTDLINQIKSYDDEIEDQRIIEKIIISIPEKFDPIIAVIENTKDLKTLGIQELLSSLKSYEQRMSCHSDKATESAFQSSLQGDKRPQPNFRRGGGALGKRHRKPFPKRVTWRAKEILELVHIDLCSPMRNPSHESFEEAIREEPWKKVTEDEIRVIEKNNTWELTDRPLDKNVIGVKWVYKVKFNADGSVQRNKARLVAKGYSQQRGIDYDETYAPVARMDTVRAIISLACQKGWLLYQLNVKSAFLNGELKKEVYVNQPQGFEVEGKEEKVYKLEKALYGLKQAPRAWYGQIDGYFKEKGFDQSKSEPTLYVKIKDTSLVVNEKLMKENGSSKVDATLYRSLVGKLLYLIATRLHIMFSTSLRFMHNPSQIHMGIGKRILRYLQGTKDFGIKYVKNANINLHGFCDSDWGGFAQSSAGGEYAATALATSQAIWVRIIFEDIGEKQMKPITILCDCMSAIAIALQRTRFIIAASGGGYKGQEGKEDDEKGKGGFNESRKRGHKKVEQQKPVSNAKREKSNRGINILNSTHSNPACKVTKDHNQILEEGVHPEVAAKAKILEAVDVNKVMREVEELTDRPLDKDVIGVKWVYKVKFNADGSVQRNKAILVAKGYSQQPGIDYDETYAPVARMDTVRAIISLACQKAYLFDKYVDKILKIFDMSECKPKDTSLVVNEKLMKEDGSSKVDATLYRSLVGKLLYLIATRPHIMFSTSLLSSDWGGCTNDMKSTSGYIFSLGSAIAIAKNPVHHSRTKHIALKHQFIREAIKDGEVQLEFCGTNDQLADIFTKALPREKFKELRRKLGV
nr:retrovirus-related Pol polyprotein from transposon TNT 1-94 [Tanacetum cinerariifolium]